MEVKHNFKLANKLSIVEELIQNEYLSISVKHPTKDDSWVDKYSKAFIVILGYIRDIKVRDDVNKLYPAALISLRKIPVWSNTGKPLTKFERSQNYGPSKSGGIPVSLYDYLYTEIKMSVDSQAIHYPEKPIDPFKYTNGYEILLVLIEEKINELQKIKTKAYLSEPNIELEAFRELYRIIANVEKLSNNNEIQLAIENILKRTYVRSDNGVKLTEKEFKFFENLIDTKDFKVGSIYPTTQYEYLYCNPPRYWIKNIEN